MAGSHLAYLSSYQAGRGSGLIDSTEMNKFFNMVLGARNGIVAHAGGGVAAATPLSLGFNSVDTVATAADSLLLPPAIMNAWCWIVNNGAASTSIYNLQSNGQNGGATDSVILHGATTIVTGSTAVTLASGHSSLFVCMSLGFWKQIADFA